MQSLKPLKNKWKKSKQAYNFKKYAATYKWPV